MSIIIDASTKVIIQGITGKEGSYWAEHMKNYGTNIVAGITPGKEGQNVKGIPVFHTIKRALEKTEIEASLLVVPPKFAKSAIYEALDAGIKKIVVTAEGIPLHESLEIRRRALTKGALIVGANTTGIMSTGKAMMGFFPYWINRVYKSGNIGVMTRSGSLTNEITAEVVKAGFGTSSIIGVGGDKIPFTRFSEILKQFEYDKETDAVVMIGEIGGTMEEEVADLIKENKFTKPLVAFMGGREAPKGIKMGHAGAIVTNGRGSVESKEKELNEAGAHIAKRPCEVGDILNSIFNS